MYTNTWYFLVWRTECEAFLIPSCFNMGLLKRNVSNGNQRGVTFVRIYSSVFILLNFIFCSCGNIYSFHINPLLDGSVSARCSKNPCRSVLEAAACCENSSSCLAIAIKGLGEKQCLFCTCPADGTTLDRDGMFYIRNVEPYLKGEYCVFC